MDKVMVSECKVGEVVELKVSLLRELFLKKGDDNTFGVYLVRAKETGEVFSINGDIVEKLKISNNVFYNLKGEVSTYKRREKVVKISSLVISIEDTGVTEYLLTLPRLGERVLNNLSKLYGDNMLEVIKNEPLRVSKEVRGIGEKTAKNWSEQLKRDIDMEKILIPLMRYGLTHKQSLDIAKLYRDLAVEKLKENPYALSKELKGYGFRRCDEIASKIGYSHKGEKRIKEGILFSLEQHASSGHCYSTYTKLRKDCRKLLNISLSRGDVKTLIEKGEKDEDGLVEYSFGDIQWKIPYKKLTGLLTKTAKEKVLGIDEDKYLKLFVLSDKEIEEVISSMIKCNELVTEEDRIYLKEYYYAEVSAASKLVELSRASIDTVFETKIDIEKRIKDIEEKNGFKLEEKQKQTLREFSISRGDVCVLDGPAGSGKTFTLNLLLDLLREVYKVNKYSYDELLLAPTGRASKVMSNYTDREAGTIHQTLKIRSIEDMTKEEKENVARISSPVVVVDEVSMTDIKLFDILLSAIPEGTKVILIGDAEQLPSVGAGNVFRDLLNASCVRRVSLDVVKRQKQHSGSALNANNILQGKMIESSGDNFFYLEEENHDKILEKTLKSIDRIIKGKKINMTDIQVLAPQKKGSLGIDNLNYELQQNFRHLLTTGDKKELIINKRINVGDELKVLYFEEGDKVINKKNDRSSVWHEKKDGKYVPIELEVGLMNGDCGTIVEVAKEFKDGGTVNKLVVEYDDGYIVYEDNFENLDHAYAMTIHKSQGSQWEAVVVPVSTQSSMMLDRNLFYTAVSRVRDFGVVIGDRKSISLAVRMQRAKNRMTTLLDRIEDENSFIAKMYSY